MSLSVSGCKKKKRKEKRKKKEEETKQNNNKNLNKTKQNNNNNNKNNNMLALTIVCRRLITSNENQTTSQPTNQPTDQPTNRPTKGLNCEVHFQVFRGIAAPREITTWRWTYATAWWRVTVLTSPSCRLPQPRPLAAGRRVPVRPSSGCPWTDPTRVSSFRWVKV